MAKDSPSKSGPKRAAYMRARRKDLWAQVRIPELRRRAKVLGIEFDLEASDLQLPEFCPIFGYKLELGVGKQTRNSPSVDRIDSTKGYIKGNVVVVSQWANTLKRNASVEELATLVSFYRNLNGKGE